MDVGNNIKKYRKSKNLTQVQLAQKINKSESTVRKYEANDVTPNFDILNKIAIALDIPIGTLIGNTVGDFDDLGKKICYKLQADSEFAEFILNYLGYTIDVSENKKGYNYKINTPGNKKLDILESDVDNIILSLKEINKFEIERILNRIRQRLFDEFVEETSHYKEGE